MSKIYPKLNSLKQKLGIKNINTGKTFTHNNQVCGIAFDDMEGLYAMGNIDNKVVLRSGTDMTHYQYRGQIEDFGICNANLFRENTKEQIFLEICRTIAFENLLDKHPYLKLIKNMRFNDSEFYINNTAIAQHYELKTPFLDLTSNFDVASFFATSKYNPISKNYEPYYNSSKLGVIYIYHEMHSSEMPFEYIGWQGLSRPEEQRASIYHLKPNEDFTLVKGVEKHYFKHSLSTSQKIWNNFNQGKLLFPDDSAGELANECKKLTSFTEEEINSASIRLNEWTNMTLTENNLEEIYEKLNINIVKSTALSWNSLIDISSLYWMEKFDTMSRKIKYRMAVNV